MARNRPAPRIASTSSSAHSAPATTSHAAPPPAAAAPATPSAMHARGAQPSSPHSTAATPPPPTQVTNIYVQRAPMAGAPSPMMGGGGGGSGLLGTMAAVAGGSVIGHGISNYLYGHGNQAPTQPAEAQQLAQAAAQENHACTAQLVGYSKCLEANPDSSDKCKWAWDYFTQCQQQHPSTSSS